MLRSSCSRHREASERTNGVKLSGLVYEDVTADREKEAVVLVYLLMKLVADCFLLVVATALERVVRCI